MSVQSVRSLHDSAMNKEEEDYRPTYDDNWHMKTIVNYNG